MLASFFDHDVLSFWPSSAEVEKTREKVNGRLIRIVKRLSEWPGEARWREEDLSADCSGQA